MPGRGRGARPGRLAVACVRKALRPVRPASASASGALPAALSTHPPSLEGRSLLPRRGPSPGSAGRACWRRGAGAGRSDALPPRRGAGSTSPACACRGTRRLLGGRKGMTGSIVSCFLLSLVSKKRSRRAAESCYSGEGREAGEGSALQEKQREGAGKERSKGRRTDARPGAAAGDRTRGGVGGRPTYQATHCLAHRGRDEQAAGGGGLAAHRLQYGLDLRRGRERCGLGGSAAAQNLGMGC
jgi:hypothetical protein